MARPTRRGKHFAPHSLRLILLVLVTFASGIVVLWGRSEDGLVARARYGLPVNRSLLARTISRTVRSTILDFGIPVGAQVIKVDEKHEPRVRWTAYLPGRSSTLQLNAKLTENLAAKHMEVIDGWEDTLAAPGSEVHLLVGAGRIVTHELVLQRRNDVVGAQEYEPARILLVIDAFGPAENDSLSREYLKLGVPLTGAVLPRTKGTREWSERLAKGGHDVLAQLPMEPMNYPQRDPGPGAVPGRHAGGADPARGEEEPGDVPDAVGATSYMGQMALADETVMGAVMTELKRAKVFYLDARTIPTSVAADRAAREGVLCFRIDTVLEAPGRYDAEVKAMNRLLDDSIDLARRRGYAIVLAHPRPGVARRPQARGAEAQALGRAIPAGSTLLTPQAD
jgi:polysaccharide deacetylase 2 family uncharacterized protein YibQ